LKPNQYSIGFIIEQALGHISHGQNLQTNIQRDAEITPYWALPVWQTKGLASKIPVVRSNWTVHAGMQTRQMLADIARKASLDALFFHTQITAVLSQDWLERYPSVVSLDATPLQYDRLGESYAHESGPAWLERLKWRLNRDCFRKANRLVTWSEWARQSLIEEYEVEPNKITVIPPGVNAAAWAAPQPRCPHQGPVKILFVGGSLKRKGGDLLLDAFRTLRQESQFGSLPEIELHLATKETLPPEAGVFIYNTVQPNSPEILRLYHDADIFCLPTRGDCLPMVLSEAGAAGLPSVTTRVAAIPEIVRQGRNGLLVEPGDVQSLTDALRQLVSDEAMRLHMGAEGVKVVRQGYDSVTNTACLLNQLKETIREARLVRQR
jgi:glycosyltransferase involved in cell wall biosynthesis